MSGPVISERVAHAMARYAKQVESVHTSTTPAKRVDRLQVAQATRAILSARELAILDMTMVKGHSLDRLAAATKQPRQQLEALLRQAGERLADYFEGATEPA